MVDMRDARFLLVPIFAVAMLVGPASAGANPFRDFGHDVKDGAREVGRAIKQGARETGHALKRVFKGGAGTRTGVRAGGHKHAAGGGGRRGRRHRRH
jgi:hypothetical protein